MGKEHVVKQGETLSEIARQHGFADWRLVYNHASNAQLRKQRPDPNVLYPGDKIQIPAVKPRTVSRKTGGGGPFTLQTRSRVLRMRLQDSQGKPLKSAEFTLEFTGKPPVKGSTKGDGTLEVPLPPTCRDAVLTVGEQTFQLQLGHLNPLDDVPDEGVSGAQSRLANLGYAVAGATGVLDPATKVALAAFQADHGLEVDGALTAATRSKLKETHGC
jgi:hypothetical protein